MVASAQDGDAIGVDPVPDKLFVLRRQHRPGLWQFVRLYPSPDCMKAVADLRSSDAAGAYCLRCKQNIYFRVGKHGVTKHMKLSHREELTDFEGRDGEIGDAPEASAVGSTTDVNLATSEEPEQKRRIRSVTTAEQEEIDRLVAAWVAESMRPLEIVEDPGLHRLMAFLMKTGNFQFRLSKRTKLRESIQVLAADRRAYTKMIILGNCNSYAMTSDMWTDRSARSFMAVTVHFIDERFLSHNYTLAVKPVNGKHSGLRISAELTEVLAVWGLKKEDCVKSVRDGASNAVAAGQDLGTDDLHCIAHRLHLVVGCALIRRLDTAEDEETEAALMSAEEGGVDEIAVGELNVARMSAIVKIEEHLQGNVPATDRDTLTEVRRAVQKFRNMAVHFRKSAKGKFHLDRIQIEQLQKKQEEVIKIKTDCPQRWNSTLDMLNRFIALETALGYFIVYLGSPEGKEEFKGSKPFLLPTPREWYMIRCMRALLAQFYEATRLLSGDSYPTLALAIPCLSVVQTSLESDTVFDQEMNRAGHDSFVEEVNHTMFQTRQILLRQFVERFSELADEISWISFLDPRLSMSHLAKPELQKAEKAILTEMMSVNVPRPQPATNQGQRAARPISNDTTPQKNQTRMLTGIMGNFAQSRAARRIMKEEFDLYRAAAVHSLETAIAAVTESAEEMMETLTESDIHVRVFLSIEPLKWWEERAKTFPRLAVLARKWLACPATSVPSERVFSAAGNIVTSKRASLHPDIVPDLVFLAQNKCS